MLNLFSGWLSQPRHPNAASPKFINYLNQLLRHTEPHHRKISWEYHSNIMDEHRFSTKWTWVSRWLVHNLSDPRLDSLVRGLIVYKSVLKYLNSLLDDQILD